MELSPQSTYPHFDVPKLAQTPPKFEMVDYTPVEYEAVEYNEAEYSTVDYEEFTQ